MRRTSFVSLILVLGLASLTLLLRANVLQVPAGTWAPGSVISNPRVSGSAVLLQNGRLLITGGDTGGGPSVAADLVAADGSASPIPSMSVPRSSHMSVALQDGRVLVAGGSTTGGGITNSAEIFDPIANTWTSIPGGMTEARAGAIAALLSDGRVLIAAGEGSSGTISSSIEIFDPVANAFSFAGTLSSPRKNHASAVLVDGRVLIVGGSDANDTLLAPSDIFDPITNTVAAGPRLSAARKSASATTLLDGRVLVAGGTGVVTNPDNPTTSVDLGSAEILDAAATAFTPSPSAMITARTGHQALLLPHNSSVLFVGGNSNGVPTASGERFVPWAAS